MELRTKIRLLWDLDEAYGPGNHRKQSGSQHRFSVCFWPKAAGHLMIDSEAGNDPFRPFGFEI